MILIFLVLLRLPALATEPMQASQVQVGNEICEDLCRTVNQTPIATDNDLGFVIPRSEFSGLVHKLSATVAGDKELNAFVRKYLRDHSTFAQSFYSELTFIDDYASDQRMRRLCRGRAQSRACINRMAEILIQLTTTPSIAATLALGRSLDRGDQVFSYKDKFVEIEEIQRAADEKFLNSPGIMEIDKKISETIFPEVKHEISSFVIEQLPASPVRDSIINRLHDLSYVPLDKLERNTMVGGSIRTIFPNASYHSKGNWFEFRAGMSLIMQSVPAIVAVVAHELAHSFDPCMAIIPTQAIFKMKFPIGIDDFERTNPFGRVLTCLRSDPDSIQAGMNAPLFGFFKACAVDFQPIQEAFADWVGVHVLTRLFKKNYSHLSQNLKRHAVVNATRFFCSNSDAYDLPAPGKIESHPSGKRRAKYIWGSQPELREFIGCAPAQSTVRYCRL